MSTLLAVALLCELQRLSVVQDCDLVKVDPEDRQNARPPLTVPSSEDDDFPTPEAKDR